MITLGDFKSYYAQATVNQSLRATNSLMGSIVHWAITEIISIADFWWNQGNTTFTTVSDQAQYFLSTRVSGNRIWGLYNQTEDRKLYEKPLEEIYNLDPTPTETGISSFWSYVSQEECQAVPTAAGTISVVSSSTQDTSKNVVIKGKASGIEQYEILSLNGTTAVTGTISWDASEPLSISLGSICSGVVTATRGSVTVASIPPGHPRVQCPLIRLNLIPDSAQTIRYFFYKRSLPLISDYEVVDLPDEAFGALRCAVAEACYALVGKLQASQLEYKKKEKAINDLVIWSERNIAQNPIKDFKCPDPVAFRLPNFIDYTMP